MRDVFVNSVRFAATIVLAGMFGVVWGDQASVITRAHPLLSRVLSFSPLFSLVFTFMRSCSSEVDAVFCTRFTVDLQSCLSICVRSQKGLLGLTMGGYQAPEIPTRESPSFFLVAVALSFVCVI
eukprot:990600-Rhodomonas_salina.2